MSRLYLPARDPRHAEEEWRQAIGPSKWKPGHSAYAFAHTWFGSNAGPPEIRAILETQPRFEALIFLVGLVEHVTELVGSGPGSHSDALIVAKQRSGALATLAIEAKVSERFGDESTQDWLAAGGGNRMRRIEDLCDEFGISVDQPELGPVRYQLVHRTAAALKEARRFNATDAIMLVHSFSAASEWLDDFVQFAGLLSNDDAESGRLLDAGDRRGVHLWLGWASGTNPVWPT